MVARLIPGQSPAGAPDLSAAAAPAWPLRCPVCGAGVDLGGTRVVCEGTSQHRFDVVAGVPLLLNPARSLFRADDFRAGARTTFKSPPRWALTLGRWLPSPSRDTSAGRCLARLAAWLRGRPPGRRRVLIVGCGDGSFDYGPLGQVEHLRWLETDVSLAGPARVVCDASDLPFEDGAFDLVVSNAVLEHVLEPQRCVDEIHRVLVNDGVVWATTPFMQQVHMGEYDFTRFTRSGHRWLFRAFDEVDSGPSTGPASVLVWSVEHFCLAWTSSVASRRIVKGTVRLALGWLTWLDPWLVRRAASLDGAGGFFFIGRRAAAASVTARDMLGYYRGGDSAK